MTCALLQLCRTCKVSKFYISPTCDVSCRRESKLGLAVNSCQRFSRRGQATKFRDTAEDRNERPILDSEGFLIVVTCTLFPCSVDVLLFSECCRS